MPPPRIPAQTDRPLKITTPLGADILLLTGLQGCEEMSQLFDFHAQPQVSSTKEIAMSR
jgi:hypothetical protein